MDWLSALTNMNTADSLRSQVTPRNEDMGPECGVCTHHPSSVLPAPSPQPQGQVSSEAMVLHYEKAGAVLMNRNCHRTSASDKVTL